MPGWLMLATLAVSATLSVEARAAEAGPDRADVVQRVLPGVVTIFMRKAPAGGEQEGTVLDYGHGAGFVIDPDGLIGTNRHNVQGARQLVVGFSDGSRALGSFVAASEKIDLALIKVTMDHKLAALTFADSDKVRVGDSVLAVGNPLGIGTSVSGGLVSALNRDIADSVYDNFIQTDAAINHGNSGGPLIDISGQVVGMNSDIFSNSGGSMGLGFALSSNDTKFLVDRLLKFGRVKAGWVGVDLQDLSPGISWSFREPKQEGAIVSAVAPDGPANAAGIAGGDIIQRIDDHTIADARDAARRFGYTPVGSTTHVTIWRNGAAVAADVRAAEIPGAEKVDNPAPLLNHFGTGGQLGTWGLKLSALTDQARQDNNLAPGQSGVLVTAVPDDVFTGQGFLVPGDIVLRVRQTSVASPAEVERCFDQAKAEGLISVALLVQKKTSRAWVPLLIADVPTKQ